MKIRTNVSVWGFFLCVAIIHKCAVLIVLFYFYRKFDFFFLNSGNVRWPCLSVIWQKGEEVRHHGLALVILRNKTQTCRNCLFWMLLHRKRNIFFFFFFTTLDCSTNVLNRKRRLSVTGQHHESFLVFWFLIHINISFFHLQNSVAYNLGPRRSSVTLQVNVRNER